jgi:hypothetical protein
VETKEDDPFGWFKLAAYAAAKSFDFSNWALMLSRRPLFRETFLSILGGGPFDEIPATDGTSPDAVAADEAQRSDCSWFPIDLSRLGSRTYELPQ